MQTVFPRLRHVAALTVDDFTQPKCQSCGRPISDDRFYSKPSKFCSKKCANRAGSERRSGKSLRRTRFAHDGPVSPERRQQP